MSNVDVQNLVIDKILSFHWYERQCSACGYKNSPDSFARFCPACGKDLKVDVEQEIVDDK